ncbi:MAG: hypothetical protein DHS20C21_07350 [Gemmatimonadota bacterium]|nr:MAG: hypothetical protein DHS20C21_07350 [Gemmatimonadota bacterium]
MQDGTKAPRTRIVILGGGFGGAYCARRLERSLRGSDVEILLIDRNNYFAFSPLLVEAGTGSLEPRHAVVPIRSFLRSASFRMAEVVRVDRTRREIRYRIEETGQVTTTRYDHLVLAMGSVSLRPPVPGLAEHGLDLKHLVDAVALRDRAVRMLEAAAATADPELRRALLHFVVVGGNFTGVEVAGEFHEFLRDACRGVQGIGADECGVTLVEQRERILGAVDPDLSDYALRQMRKRGIRVVLKDSVARIAATEVLLQSGETVRAHTTVWCAGIAPSPLNRELDLPVDERGYLVCNLDLRVQGHEDIWAIGDCAVTVDPTGHPNPATAQQAVREADHLARNLRSALRGEPTRDLTSRNLGSLVALGRHTGVAKVMGLKFSGFAAWFLWRTVYLMKMPGWARRIRVALDWTGAFLFPRDVVQLGIHRTVSREEKG